MTINKDVVENLARSMGVVGQLAPALYCRQHPQKLLSGHHRLAAGATETREVDVDAVAQANHISHNAAETLVVIEANTQRQVPREERAETVLSLCKELARENREEKVASIVVGLLREEMSKSTVYSLIPDSYKSPTRPRRDSAPGNSGQLPGPVGPTEPKPRPSFSDRELRIFRKHGLDPIIRKDGSVVWNYGSMAMADSTVKGQADYIAAKREIDGTYKEGSDAPEPLDTSEGGSEKRREYSGSSKRMSESTVKADTPSENELQDLIQSIRLRGKPLSFRFNNPIEFAEGKAYTPDAVISDWLILEVEGDGSASADNEKRDATLMAMGKRLLHLTNRRITDPDYQDLVAQSIRLCLELGPPPTEAASR